MSLVLENVCYSYEKGKKTEKVLDNVSITIEGGKFVGIIGHTGSGKSTLVQHMNGLLKADSGRIFFNGEDIYGKKYKLSELRKQVGLVFQYPEYQLFNSTVLEDVAYGPNNKWKDADLALNKAKEALNTVGIDETLFDKSPFELSGGEKRRVAIAGVLAMEPDILILDEPTAGLDPKGRDEILEQLKSMQLSRKIDVVLVSHSMEDVAKIADRIVVMNNGKIVYDGTPKEVFKNYKELENIGLSAPEVTYLWEKLEEKNVTGKEDREIITTVEDAIDKIERILGVL
ncbi:MAG: energy-coupling factor transporter ATPase [Lachnospiraceae bacterium]|nr:energy-coupling factor transporter ATPase [Lachnospiraceae bacterium]